MKQKDMNKMFNEKEFGRLKDILFPHKQKKQTQKTQITHPPEHERRPQLNIKNQIQKLRSQIYRKLEKENSSEQSEVQTQRIYLDGINKICKNLKDYSKEISQVFQDFLQHLPTNLNTHKKNYINHYFFSLLIQNSIWGRIDSIIKKPMSEAFRAIQEEYSSIREENELQKSIKSKWMLRQKSKNLFSTNKYFSLWRFKSKAVRMQVECLQYCKQNCLENDKKILQNLLNFPWFVLMLEEINKQNADLCEILLLDEKTKKLCKFVDENTDCLNSSLQTVTQRSMLHSQAQREKIKRHQFEVDAGLTKLCLQRQEVFFITNLTKHPDFHVADQSCYSQFADLAKRANIKGGAIFYPIIGSDQQLIGVMRQYFYHKNIKSLSSQKTNKLSMLLELGLSVQNRMRKISDEAKILKEKHYLKMIFLIKKLENQSGNITQILNILSQELQTNFNIQQMAVFRVYKKQYKTKSEIMLSSLWGENKEHTFLLSMVDKILREGNNFVYLEKRLLVYHNMMLFDLCFTQIEQHLKGYQRKPVELLTATLAKIQTIISKKQQQSDELRHLQEKAQKQLLQKQKQLFVSAFEKQKLVLFSQMTEPCNRIINFLNSIRSKSRICFSSQQEELTQIDCCLQVLGWGEKSKTRFFALCMNGWQQKKQETGLNNQYLKIKINSACNLYLTNPSINAELNLDLQSTIQQYLTLYTTNQSPTEHTIDITRFTENASELVNQCNINSVPLANQTKQEWEIQQLKRIYKTMHNIIGTFTDQFFISNQGVAWLREEPSTSNIQEWKQAVYPFVFAQSDKITVSIRVSNQNQGLRQYTELERIFGTNIPFGQLYNECYFQIVIASNQSKFRRMSYQSPITFKMIVRPCLQESTQFKYMYQTAVCCIKTLWIQLSKSLIQGNLKIDEKNKTKNAMRIIHLLERKAEQTYYTTLQCIRSFVQRKNQVIHQTSKILSIRKYNDQTRIWHYLAHFKEEKFRMTAANKLRKFNSTTFISIQRILNKLAYRRAFDCLCEKYQKGSNIFKIESILLKIRQQKQLVSKCIAFSQIYHRSKMTKPMSLLIPTLSQLFKRKLQQNYYFFISAVKANQCHDFKEERNPEAILSIKELQLLIKQETPEFNLFLTIDSFHCLPLYTPSHNNQISTIQEVNMPCEPFSVYQIGSEGQFIWHYFLKEGQNGFKIKDKLNSLSKFIEQALKHCKQLFSLKLLNMKCLRSKYIQYLKTKYLRKWRNECDLLAIQQKNRLNDCLYQLNVESQTTKQKLIVFQKMLKSNYLIFEEMKKKRGQYMGSVVFSETQVSKIEQSYDKLENARNMYTKLHQRTVLKSCLLLWRSNSKKIEYKKKKHCKLSIKCSKIAFKSIVSIVEPKYKNILSKVLHSLVNSCRKYSTKREVQKIDVFFEEKSRLVTFQSEINEKENISDRSNSFDSPDSKREVCLAVSKFKINEMKAPNQVDDLSAEQMSKYNNGAYKLNPKTLKFLKRMGKLSN